MAGVSDIRETISRDWSSLSEVTEKVDGLKAVLDIERRIANWWQELPYPLAAASSGSRHDVIAVENLPEKMVRVGGA